MLVVSVGIPSSLNINNLDVDDILNKMESLLICDSPINGRMLLYLLCKFGAKNLNHYLMIQ
jgi:hypothetical protein